MKSSGIFLMLLFVFCFHNSKGQTFVQDSLKLPFAIAKEKRLSTEDLQNKKEGTYLTGVPDISSDPINGFGVGAEAQLFFNGKRTDPFFAYTPFRAQLNVEVFYSTLAQRNIRFDCDIPYLFNTKWRFRGELGYEVNPNLLYFGITEKSLQPLSFYPDNDMNKPIVNNASYDAYENSLIGNRRYYNNYQKEEAVMNLIFERSFLEGKWRAFFGFEISNLRISTPLNDSSYLHVDAMNGNIKGYGNNFVPLIQAGLIYDTRDLETDPSSGSFAEFTNELSFPALGSPYRFNKSFIHYNFYHRIFTHSFKKLVVASRAGIGNLFGDAPFYEFMDEESSEATIEALGGGKTLRGYKQNRFAARAIGFANVELRYRFYQCTIFKQHLAFSTVPFFDLGGAWDNLERISKTQNLRYSEGLGLRIAWNENTILRFDYAISKEDKQFFFELHQSF
jgi:outer membrane protein assembly factor BamA